MKRKRNFIVSFVFIFLLFSLGGCGTDYLNLSKRSHKETKTNIHVQQPIVLIVAHTKDDKWIPKFMFASNKPTENSALALYLLSSHYETIPFIFKGNDFYIWGDHCKIKKDGQFCDCTRIRGKETFCKYNTPFFDNGFMGMRIKPYGVVSFNKEKTIAYFQEQHILDKIRKYSQILLFNLEHFSYFENLRNKVFQELKGQILKAYPNYKKQKPKIKFVVLNDKIKGVEFNPKKIKYNYNFKELDKQYLQKLKKFSMGNRFAIKAIDNMFDDSLKKELPKTPKLKVVYNFQNNLVYIYIPNSKKNKKFKIENTAQIKNFISDFYKKEKEAYIEKLETKKAKILKEIKQKLQYVVVEEVMCTKSYPCSTKKSIYKINYYFTNIKPKDKLYLNKLNIIKVNGSREVLKNAVLQKPNVIFEDKNLKIAVINNKIHLINKTKKFIKVKSLAEYIKDKIYNLGSYILPPEADKTIDSMHKIPFTTLNERIFYGFAISYELDGKEFNFYKHKSFVAKSLIK